jgi:hypothetical protein
MHSNKEGGFVKREKAVHGATTSPSHRQYGTAIAKTAIADSQMSRRGWIRTTYEYKKTKALAMEGFHFDYRSFADCGLATR